jgi:hypothetical protein
VQTREEARKEGVPEELVPHKVCDFFCNLASVHGFTSVRQMNAHFLHTKAMCDL